MTAGRSDRRVVQLRRRGRHSSPSQVEKVALQAGKAAPAVAIAGALVPAPPSAPALADAKPAAAVTAEHQTAETTAARTQSAPATKATLDSFETKTVTVAASKTAKHSTAARKATYYRVRSGDSLSKIARQHYGNASDWRYLYSVNAKTISNPDDIFAGERILLPATVPGHYTPKHAKAAAVTETTSKETAKRPVATKHKAAKHSTVVIERSAA